ncbi:hypothetical protein D0817_16570 [Flavobacterium cupreum]|uniref:Carboxypeptidase regulatory-like domain-containing protein n=1 Tax=Flavobacterium cupreum TaxID=2133766 RepID=A0A434A4W8_9FLAO|nr:hypothetical protein [Flavobacterium cupreum]RUT69448.1 hypothetical protein D0817_16570 [Flavobacterium cupreum]
MKKITWLFFLHLAIVSFGQEAVTKNKLIRGFVFDNSYFASIPLPVNEAPIEIMGTERKTKTDHDGKFEIEAKEGDELIIRGPFIKTKKILITDKNCYEINLGTVLLDYPISFQNKRAARKNSRSYRKIVKKLKQKIESGFYNCLD